MRSLCSHYILANIVKKVIRSSTDHSDLLRLNNVPAAETQVQCKFTLRDDPLLANDVPIGQITAHELEANSLALTSLEVDLLEATELLGRCASRGAIREANIQLRDSSTGHIAGVGERDGDVVDRLPKGGVATGHDLALLRVSGDIVRKRLSLNIGDVEGGVGKTEAELVANRDVMGIEVTVVNLKLLVKPGLPIK